MFASSTSSPPADRLAPSVVGARLDRAAYTLLLVTLIWAPWPLGSNRPWALALLGFGIWTALAFAAAARWTSASAADAPTLRRGWAIPLVALAGFAALLTVQLWPGLGDDGGVISIDPHATRHYLYMTLVYAGAWMLVLATVTSGDRLTRLLAALLVAGVLQAVAAVLLSSSGASYTLWLTPFSPDGRARGTFPNPDHLAGYMELTLAAGLGWLLSQFESNGGAAPRHWRGRIVVALDFLMSPKMLLRLVLVVLVIALVMTHSRMGNGAFFLSLLLVGTVVAVRSPRLRKPAIGLVVSMAIVDVFIVGQWVGLDRVVERLTDTVEAGSPTLASFGLEQAPPPREESLAKRLEVPRLSLQLVAERPWLGHGGGTYVTAFPPYKTAGLPWHWTHAHDDYVQVAVDTGLVGLALWLTVGLASFSRAIVLVDDAEARANRGAAVAALMALFCMGLHSIVDFNLHIPANALTFSILLAAVWTVPPAGRRPAPGMSPHRSRALRGAGPAVPRTAA